MKARIETKRLILRNIYENDAYSMFETYCHDEMVTKYITWYPHKTVDFTKQRLKEKILPQIDNPHFLVLAITMKNNESYVIGEISMTSLGHNRVEIGYVIGRDYWQQGIVSEAAQAFCEYIFNHFDIETIYACIDNENIASKRVLEKNGFTYSHQQYERKKFDSTDNDVVLCSYYILKRQRNS